MNDNEEMALIDIMVCACKQASTRQGPPGRTARKGKENKSSVNDKKELSAHFMQTLPSLLNKVQYEGNGHYGCLGENSKEAKVIRELQCT